MPNAPRFLDIRDRGASAPSEELATGLLASPASLAPKFFYDALGSRLFDAITELPEYYLTRAEAEILGASGGEIAAVLPRDAVFVDLGAGDCRKAAGLFERVKPACYVAVDISTDHLRHALDAVQREYPALELWGVGMDFSREFPWPEALPVPEDRPRLLFYPGSSLGNFTPEAACLFLRDVHRACGREPGSGLLIGVDLEKDIATLEAAYDDALGVTAAFNRNVLLNVNRLLGADFIPADWRHVVFYDPAAHRIEMHLEAERPVAVNWPSGRRTFAAGERIHTENSYKWSVGRFEALLAEAGFGAPRLWTDAASRFALAWAPACSPQAPHVTATVRNPAWMSRRSGVKKWRERGCAISAAVALDAPRRTRRVPNHGAE